MWGSCCGLSAREELLTIRKGDSWRGGRGADGGDRLRLWVAIEGSIGIS